LIMPITFGTERSIRLPLTFINLGLTAIPY
jgi:hypothetical protein